MGGPKRNILVAIAVVLAVLLVAYYALRPGNGAKTVTDTVRDGDSVKLVCGGSAEVRVGSATYGPAKALQCAAVDVTAFMRSWVRANPGKAFTVSPTAFPGVAVPPCGAQRQLVITHECAAQEHFMPRRVDVCAAGDRGPAPPKLAAESRVVPEVTPWDPDSRQQLETSALTAGARKMHRPVNPLTRIGVTARVRNWDGRAEDISSSPCSSAASVYQVQPFQPGYLVRASNDSTDGTMEQRRTHYQPAYWSRASGPYGGPYRPVASCPEDYGVDSDFGRGAHEAALVADTMVARRQPWVGDRSDLAEVVAAGAGAYASTASPARRLGAAPEALRALASADQCLTGVGCGLGSTWVDPRFEPGTRQMCCGGSDDAAYAHGGHAGGPTFGAFIPADFQTGGSRSRYVRGYGDGDFVAPPGW